jgi:hypothetical protein
MSRAVSLFVPPPSPYDEYVLTREHVSHLLKVAAGNLAVIRRRCAVCVRNRLPCLSLEDRVVIANQEQSLLKMARVVLLTDNPLPS